MANEDKLLAVNQITKTTHCKLGHLSMKIMNLMGINVSGDEEAKYCTECSITKSTKNALQNLLVKTPKPKLKSIGTDQTIDANQNST